MKRLAMLLGSILVVSAVASAKEVVAQPVIIEEPVMVEEVMVEEPVVMAAFKPTGYVGLEYRGYGDTEGQNDKISKTGSVKNSTQDEWNRGANKYSRLQTSFGVQATEKFKLEGRVRDYNNLERTDNSRVPNKDSKAGTDTRLRAYYDHSEMLTSRVEFRDHSDNKETYEYQLRVTPYRNEGGILDMVTIAPKYKFSDLAKENYTNTFGTDLYLTGNLPLGFTWENNLYLNYNMYNDEFATEMKNGKLETEKKEFEAIWELYLYKTLNIYTGDTYKVDFNFEGGYDAYTMNQYKRVAIDPINMTVATTGKEAYSLYTTMDVSLTYSLTEALSMKTGAGAEYRNWNRTAQSGASNWRWQPLAYASMNVKF
ncbi:MAG: FomA family porin-like outer membrane protein [Fusobacteriaceae bacterium]